MGLLRFWQRLVEAGNSEAAQKLNEWLLPCILVYLLFVFVYRYVGFFVLSNLCLWGFTFLILAYIVNALGFNRFAEFLSFVSQIIVLTMMLAWTGPLVGLSFIIIFGAFNSSRNTLERALTAVLGFMTMKAEFLEFVRSYIGVEPGHLSVTTVHWLDVTCLVFNYLIATAISNAQRHRYRAQELALQQALKANSHFLRALNHELRTPLNSLRLCNFGPRNREVEKAVRAKNSNKPSSLCRHPLTRQGFNELLLATELTPEQLHFARIVQGSAESITALLGDILSTSKIMDDSVSLFPTAQPLRAFLEGCLQGLQGQADNKQLFWNLDVLSFAIPLSDTSAVCLLDSNRVRQVLTNLVNNALSFAWKRVEVDVTASCVKAGSLLLELVVADDGPGISPEDSEWIFLPYWKGANSNGHGLGLSIVKKLVKMMKGNIQVGVSKLGGALFRVSFYLVLAEPQADSTATAVLVNFSPQEKSTLYSLLSKFRVETFEGSVTSLWDSPNNLPGVVFIICGKESPYFGPVLGTLSAPQPRVLNVVWDPPPAHLAGVFVTWPPANDTFQAALGQVMAETGDALTVGRVLLAEDNIMNQRLCQRFLGSYPVPHGVISTKPNLTFSVVTASNGLEAVERASAAVFDCILMDVEMPVMGGLEATRKIREAGPNRNTPIVALTANAGIEDRTLCFENGMSDYVVKPLSRDSLRAALVRVSRPNLSPNSPAKPSLQPNSPPPQPPTLDPVQSDFSVQPLTSGPVSQSRSQPVETAAPSIRRSPRRPRVAGRKNGWRE